MMQLYHWKPVSHSAKVLICLKELGVDYESRFVDLLSFEQFSKNFLAMNPAGQVPVLVVDGEALTESTLINEYLAERYPDAGLAPADPLGWYNCQSWSKYIDYNLSSSLATLGCRKYLVPELRGREDMAGKIAAIPVEERKAGWQHAADDAYSDNDVGNSERKVRLVVERCESVLAEADWLVGDAYSIADINTFAMLHGIAEVAPELVAGGVAPNTRRWFELVAARSAVQEALAVHAGVPGFAPGSEHSRWG